MSASDQQLEYSVVVCTRNRAGLLGIALDSLAKQDFPKERFEVVVVNNNSDDETDLVIESHRPRFLHFRSAFEPTVGVACARNMGLRVARASIVAFLDDDAKAPQSWLTQASIFRKSHPGIRVFGGGYVGFTQSPKPAWYPPEYGTFLLGNKARRLRPGKEYLGASNMFVHKKEAALAGGFDPLLGMKGGTIGYGEETKLQQQFFLTGHDIYYVPELTIEHLIADYKLSLKWLIKSSYAAGRSSNQARQRDDNLLLLLGKFGYGMCKGLIRFSSLRRIPLKRRWYYLISELAYRVAALAQTLDKREMR